MRALVSTLHPVAVAIAVTGALALAACGDDDRQVPYGLEGAGTSSAISEGTGATAASGGTAPSASTSTAGGADTPSEDPPRDVEGWAPLLRGDGLVTGSAPFSVTLDDDASGFVLRADGARVVVESARGVTLHETEVPADCAPAEVRIQALTERLARAGASFRCPEEKTIERGVILARSAPPRVLFPYATTAPLSLGITVEQRGETATLHLDGTLPGAPPVRIRQPIVRDTVTRGEDNLVEALNRLLGEARGGRPAALRGLLALRAGYCRGGDAPLLTIGATEPGLDCTGGPSERAVKVEEVRQLLRDGQLIAALEADPGPGDDALDAAFAAARTARPSASIRPPIALGGRVQLAFTDATHVVVEGAQRAEFDLEAGRAELTVLAPKVPRVGPFTLTGAVAICGGVRLLGAGEGRNVRQEAALARICPPGPSRFATVLGTTPQGVLAATPSERWIVALSDDFTLREPPRLLASRDVAPAPIEGAHASRGGDAWLVPTARGVLWFRRGQRPALLDATGAMAIAPNGQRMVVYGGGALRLIALHEGVALPAPPVSPAAPADDAPSEPPAPADEDGS